MRKENLGSEILDPESLAALEEGLKAAETDPRRWTTEELRADAAMQWPDTLR